MPTPNPLTNLSNGELADLRVQMAECLHNIDLELRRREAAHIQRAVQAYREAGKLSGFQLLVAERKANDQALSPSQRQQLREQREWDKKDLSSLF